MKKLKKFWSLALVLSMAFCLTAAGPSASATHLGVPMDYIDVDEIAIPAGYLPMGGYTNMSFQFPSTSPYWKVTVKNTGEKPVRTYASSKLIGEEHIMLCDTNGNTAVLFEVAPGDSVTFYPQEPQEPGAYTINVLTGGSTLVHACVWYRQAETVEELFSAGPFEDIPADADYLDAVWYVNDNGLMAGTSSTAFSPDSAVNRAMMWTLLARMNGVTPENGTPWYAPAQAWAVSAGLSDGTAPERNVSLQEAVTMLYRQAGSPVNNYAESYKHIYKKDVNTNLDGTAADWAQDAMAWALYLQLIDGGDPAGSMSRAGLTDLLFRYEAYGAYQNMILTLIDTAWN